MLLLHTMIFSLFKSLEAFKNNVIINVYLPSRHPCGNLVWNYRECMEALFFIQICFITGTLPFLETPMVEFVKFLGDSAFQVFGGIKYFVTELCDDGSSDFSDFWLEDSCRHDCRLVILPKS